jgi:photosystem II stability/assembly factor-like uncharacterized protein
VRNLAGASFASLAAAVVLLASCGSSPPAKSHSFATTTTVPSKTTTTPPSVPSDSIESVAFFNAADGFGLFALSNGSSCSLAVAPTDDGGSTFATAHTVMDYSCVNGSSAGRVAFDNVGDGFVYGPRIFISHDNGSTWNAAKGISDVLDLVPLGRSVWALDQSCSSDNCEVGVEQSGDGGRMWSTVTLPSSEMTSGAPAMLRLSVTSTLIVIPPALVVGGSPPTTSLLLRTTDDGRTWQQSSVPCVGLSTFLSQAPDGSIWLGCASEPGAGNQAKQLVRSFDGGVTWRAVQCSAATNMGSLPGCYFSNAMDSGYLGDLVAASSTTAFADGGRNDVLVTRDGGTTWSETNPVIGDMDSGTGGLFFANADDGWVISGATGTGNEGLWKTTDGGNTWTPAWTAGAGSQF